jgi:hypothetical protein
MDGHGQVWTSTDGGGQVVRRLEGWECVKSGKEDCRGMKKA